MLNRILPILLAASGIAFGQFGGNATRLRNQRLASPLTPTDGSTLVWSAAASEYQVGAMGATPAAPTRNTFSTSATSVVVTHNYGFAATGWCGIGTTASFVPFFVDSITTTSSATTFNFVAASGNGFCEVLANGAGGVGGATTALNNLASVSINAALIPQTGLSLGATATPWRYAYIYGEGTFASHSFRLGGTHQPEIG